MVLSFSVHFFVFDLGTGRMPPKATLRTPTHRDTGFLLSIPGGVLESTRTSNKVLKSRVVLHLRVHICINLGDVRVAFANVCSTLPENVAWDFLFLAGVSLVLVNVVYYIPNDWLRIVRNACATLFTSIVNGAAAGNGGFHVEKGQLARVVSFLSVSALSPIEKDKQTKKWCNGQINKTRQHSGSFRSSFC